MNTKLVMTSSSIVLAAAGIVLIFSPDAVLKGLGMEINRTSLLLGQVLGGLYFGYSMLNWMTKESLIGGIYNRPIAIGNFTHFLIAGLSILKALLSNTSLPLIVWLAGAVYLVFGLSFTIILFRHPVNPIDDKQ